MKSLLVKLGVVVMFSLIMMVWGCGDSKKIKEAKQAEEKQRQGKIDKNKNEEDIVLLSIKYEIEQERLEQIISEYEKMVLGFSIVEMFKKMKKRESIENIELSSNEEIVDVPTALNRVSEKYGISKKVLATLIIERRIILSSSKD